VDIPLSDTRTLAVTRVVVELEQHVAADGWDAPIRIFALVRTAGALERDPSLTQRLPADVIAAARADPDHLTATSRSAPSRPTLSDDHASGQLPQLLRLPPQDGGPPKTERPESLHPD
jgi:hypothetical protein